MLCEGPYPQNDILWLLTDEGFRFSPIQMTITIKDEKRILDALEIWWRNTGVSAFGMTINLTCFKVCCNYVF